MRLVGILGLFFLVAVVPAKAVSLSESKTKTVVFLGDSITEGLGVDASLAYPTLLEKKLSASGQPIRSINSGISGSTMASAPDRMAKAVKKNPDLIVLALGANDALRGIPSSEVQKNLHKALSTAKAAKIPVLLVGIHIQHNYGAVYSQQFEKVYKDLSQLYKVPLVPDLLKGVTAKVDLNQGDGIHPNPQGHLRIAETLAPSLSKILKAQGKKT